MIKTSSAQLAEDPLNKREVLDSNPAGCSSGQACSHQPRTGHLGCNPTYSQSPQSPYASSPRHHPQLISTAFHANSRHTLAYSTPSSTHISPTVFNLSRVESPTSQKKKYLYSQSQNRGMYGKFNKCLKLFTLAVCYR